MMEQKIERKNWFDERGDETLALDWPLDADSHVWEIGGFEGRWVEQIYDKFGCFIDVFEPQMWAVERMREKFGENDKITIHPYGLWIDNAYLRMSVFGTDGATVMGNKGNGKVEMGEFRLYSEALEMFFPHSIDVGLMNIEGAEWLLLPAIIKNGWITKFENFWCQFHHDFEMYAGQNEKIFKDMADTHDLLWDCYPTAVAWRKR